MNSEHRTKQDTIMRILMNSYYWMLSVAIMNFLFVYWFTLYDKVLKEITIFHILIYLFLWIWFFVIWYIIWQKIHNTIFKNNFKFWNKNVSYFLVMIITWFIFLTFNWYIFVWHEIFVEWYSKFPIFTWFYIFYYYFISSFIWDWWGIINGMFIPFLILTFLMYYFSEKKYKKNIETQDITDKLIIFYFLSIITPIFLLIFNLF